MHKKSTVPRVRINCIIEGEPATWLLEWKEIGLVNSNNDAVRQSFICFQEKIIKRDNLQQKTLAEKRV